MPREVEESGVSRLEVNRSIKWSDDVVSLAWEDIGEKLLELTDASSVGEFDGEVRITGELRLERVDPQVIGYVADNIDEPVTVCTDCVDFFPETEAEIRDGEAYGDQVPYPECYECGEVIRP